MHRPARVFAAVLSALAGAAWSGTALAQDAPPACPVFLSTADPAYCHITLPPPLPDDLPDVVPLAYDPDNGLRLLTRRPLFGPQDVSLLTRYGSLETPEAKSDLKVGARQIDDTAALQPGSVSKAYDVPFLDGLDLSNTSTVSQRSGDPGADNAPKSVNSKFGLAFEEYGLTFRSNPDAAVNWSELAGSSNRRLGIDNSVSAVLARDLTLTLSTAYDTQSSPGNPMSVASNERHRIAIAQHFATGYRFGVSGQRRNEYRFQEERDLNILGLQVGVPLGESLNLTASHEFGIGEKRSLGTTNAVPFYGQQQSLDLQLQWTPALLARKAMTIMAGYTITQDEMSGAPDPYLTQARLNLAMRF